MTQLLIGFAAGFGLFCLGYWMGRQTGIRIERIRCDDIFKRYIANEDRLKRDRGLV